MEATDMTWRKSTYSGGANGACVEVGGGNKTIAIRDTKEAHMSDTRTILGFTATAWGEFLSSL